MLTKGQRFPAGALVVGHQQVQWWWRSEWSWDSFLLQESTGEAKQRLHQAGNLRQGLYTTPPKFNMVPLEMMLSKKGISYSFRCYFQVNHVKLSEGMCSFFGVVGSGSSNIIIITPKGFKWWDHPRQGAVWARFFLADATPKWWFVLISQFAWNKTYMPKVEGRNLRMKLCLPPQGNCSVCSAGC